ncbi:claudin-12 [Arapaima gigas]
MTCRDIHATNVFAFIVALVSVGGLTMATLIPQWRITRLVTFNRNARNVSVYDGLWAKCVQQEGSSGCYFYDTEWYVRVDQLDLRVLQFALPFSLLFSTLALLLTMCGMCKTACCSSKPEVTTGSCLVNSAGCHLVAGLLLFLSGSIAMAPSVWFLFYTKQLNRKYDNLFSNDFAVYVAIGCSGGLILAALLFCMCYPSPVYAPQPFAPQGYTPVVSADPMSYVQPQAYVAPHGYAPSVVAQPAYVSQVSVPNGYGSEAYAAHNYAPSQAYGSSYGGPRHSTRSRLSTIEIDIPVLTQGS